MTQYTCAVTSDHPSRFPWRDCMPGDLTDMKFPIPDLVSQAAHRPQPLVLKSIVSIVGQSAQSLVLAETKQLVCETLTWFYFGCFLFIFIIILLLFDFPPWIPSLRLCMHVPASANWNMQSLLYWDQ